MINKLFFAFILEIASKVKRILVFFGFPKEGIFRKHAEVADSKDFVEECLTPILEKLSNPILEPINENFWESKAVFNPAAIYEDDKVHLVYRAVGDNDVSVWGYAVSSNGIQIDKRFIKPIYEPREPFEGVSGRKFTPLCSSYYISGPGYGGCEDPRITKIGGTFYVTYTAFNGIDLPRLALTSIKVEDFLNGKWNWSDPVLISPPDEVHKNWVIFPEKIKGKYAILHSISPNILVDYFDSLEFDGTTFIKSCYGCESRKNVWDNRVRGAGPPPIKTKDGWLLLYHAMELNDPNKYKIGAMLLDHNDPTKVLHRSAEPILEPDARYENDGLKAGVVYTCGAVVVDDKLIVYYGGADTVVCAAVARLESFLHQLKTSQSIKLTFAYA